LEKAQAKPTLLGFGPLPILKTKTALPSVPKGSNLTQGERGAWGEEKGEALSSGLSPQNIDEKGLIQVICGGADIAQITIYNNNLTPGFFF